MWFLISPAELEKYLDENRDMVLIDLRDRDSYRAEHVRGAVNIPFEELDQRLHELPKDSLIVLYCYRGPHSMLAARALSRQGYAAADVCGGYANYRGKYRTSQFTPLSGCEL